MIMQGSTITFKDNVEIEKFSNILIVKLSKWRDEYDVSCKGHVGLTQEALDIKNKINDAIKFVNFFFFKTGTFTLCMSDAIILADLLRD